MKSPLRPLCIFAASLALWLAGCGTPELQVIRQPGAEPAPQGKLAVLHVSVPDLEKVMSLGFLYSTVQAPNADSAFAEMAAAVARDDGGLDVIQPWEVDMKLKAAGMTPMPRPERNRLEEYVAALGCDAYLTATVHEWHYTYKLFWVKAVARFDLECHVPGKPEAIWTVKANYVRKGKSERETAWLALHDAFRSLAALGLVPGNKKP